MEDPRQERMIQFDQQFEFQVAMVLAGVVPHSGTSIDFIIKTLERQHYDPGRLAEIKKLVPLIKEEIEYLNTQERFHYLQDKREERLRQIDRFVHPSQPPAD